MGSFFPFKDPSQTPSQAPGLSNTLTTTTPTPLFKVPKLEPKFEPFDGSLEVYPSIPDSTLDTSLYSQTTPPPPSYSPGGPTGPISPTDQYTPYSEYARVSELFPAAFSQRIGDWSGESSGSDFSRAIVPFPGEKAQSVSVVPAQPKKKKPAPRSSELVRVSYMSEHDKFRFREHVRRTRMLFDALRIYIVVEEGKRQKNHLAEGKRARGDLKAAEVMASRDLWLNRDKRIVGSIPGIEIGDVFFYRMELCVVGLHGHTQAGIDYLTGTRSSSGEPVATSIIVSGGYEDDEDAGDVLIYTGQGGQDKYSKQCMNQTLEGGNLALERSMHYRIEVRVIRGVKYDGSSTSKVYVYDGLYRIESYWFDVGKSGFGVYKFKLSRIDGQPMMGSAILEFAHSLRTQPLNVRPKGYLSLDLSNKKESVPVLLFNDIDEYHDPLYFDYLPKTVFPSFVISHGTSGSGCDCVSSCTDGCFCARKNGGEFAYDQNGLLLRGKPLIYECGPFCQCPPSCQNRVTQRGLRHRLEVYRSTITGWAVRSLDLIHAGEFICEYTGIILTREQAQVFAMNGDSLIHPSRFAKKWTEWGDLSKVYPDYKYPSHPSVLPLDFAMDVSRMRNAACYMSHSLTPNVMVQLVLYDHNNLMFPHLMLFALENITPLTDLCLDYGVGMPREESTRKLAICN